MKKISAIIACYNDAPAIPIMYKRLTSVFKKIHVSYEIIFVNDGSHDNTEHVLKSLTHLDPHVIGITHSRNFGSQMAFTSGMDKARGDAVVFLDGDLQDPPEVIEKLYEKWRKGYDVVYGIRVRRQTTPFFQIAYKIFYRVFRKLSYIQIPLDAGDFSLIDIKVVRVLKTFPERDRFMRGLRAWAGFRQTGVSYVRDKRRFGRSTNSLIAYFRWAIKGIFSFSYAPLQAVTIVSFASFTLSVCAIIFQLLTRIFFPDITPKGITTLIIIILFIGSVQLLGIAIIGEYIAKIFEEVKGRPKYIVTHIVRKGKEEVV